MKNYLQSPIYLVGQIQTFTQLCQENRISTENISRANSLLRSIEQTQIKEIEAYNALIGFVCTAIDYWRKANYREAYLKSLRETAATNNATQSNKPNTPATTKKEVPYGIISAREPKTDRNLITPLKVVAEPERSRKSSVTYETPRKDSIKIIERDYNQGGSVLDRFDQIRNRAPKRFDEKMLLKSTASNEATPIKKLEKPNLAKNILRLPQNHLIEKLNQAKEEKSNRKSYCHTERSALRPEDQKLVADIIERKQMQEDTQNYKQIARDFRQKTVKLLIEQGKKVINEIIRSVLIKNYN